MYFDNYNDVSMNCLRATALWLLFIGKWIKSSAIKLFDCAQKENFDIKCAYENQSADKSIEQKHTSSSCQNFIVHFSPNDCDCIITQCKRRPKWQSSSMPDLAKISSDSLQPSVTLVTGLIHKQNKIVHILHDCHGFLRDLRECNLMYQSIPKQLEIQQLTMINLNQKVEDMAVSVNSIKSKEHFCRKLFTNSISNEYICPVEKFMSKQGCVLNDEACGDVSFTKNMTDIKKPSIPVEYGSKVPTNIRQRYLNVFCDECLKIYHDAEEAFERAKQEEQSVYDRSISRTVYLNVAVNAVKRLRNEAVAGPSATSQPSAVVKPTKRIATTTVACQPASKKMSHEAILGGAKAAKTSYSVRATSRSVSMDCLSDSDLYKLLQIYLLSKEDMEVHGFPLVCPSEHGKAIILKPEAKPVNSSDPTVRCCARCGKTFRISFTGQYITKEECVHHWGKAWKKRINGSIEVRYTCCQGDSESDGCCLAKVHVTDQKDYDNLVGFVKTLPKTPPIDGNFGIFALDCEMCYTTQGSELTRITVIDTHLKPVYEALVKPDNPIVDYNTRFSGLTEEDMKGVKTSLRDVQAVLLNKFNDKTILIGHSLESDFMALKLIHNTIVDTSVVFPHRLGLPYKRALRTLMAEYIKKIIQDDITGHDSQEDAAACMELMLWKIKEDLKKLLR